MSIEKETLGSFVVIRLGGKYLDAGEHNLLREELDSVVDMNPQIIIDLSGCNFMDSTGIGVIVATLHRARAAGGNLLLCNASETLENVFRMVRIHRLIDVYDTLDQALAAFGTA